MPASSNMTEEIIEKKASAPVAMSCLIIACVAILGAIAFQITEIAGYLSGAQQDEPIALAKRETKKFSQDVQAVLEKGRDTKGGEPQEATGAAPDATPAPRTPPDEEKAGGDTPGGTEPAASPKKASAKAAPQGADASKEAKESTAAPSSDAGAADAGGGEAKDGDAKDGDAKESDSKDADSKDGDAKEAETKDGGGSDAKDESK